MNQSELIRYIHQNKLNQVIPENCLVEINFNLNKEE
jgi:hypothetical protein